jgi:endonuclease/exonuclease/phosphatase family metal-dependent hydrolase
MRNGAGRAAAGLRSAAALVLALSAGGGCAKAVSYLDAAGPVYRYGATSDRAGAGSSLPPPVAAPFRVVSFNIEYALRIDAALEALAASPALRHPDLLALQEMDPPGVEKMARELGMHAVYFPSGVHPKHRKDFGCALLSPWPLEEPRKLVLPHGARVTGLRRAAVSAVVVRGGLRVRAYSVHLPSPLAVSKGSRREQVRALVADAARFPEPIVIAGDFNSYRMGGEFVAGGFQWTTRYVGPTARWRFGGLGYDHVFVRGLSVTASGREEHRGASDHNPIWSLVSRDEAALLADTPPQAR